MAEFKHEYRDGYMVPIQGPDALPVNMAGGKGAHSKLKTNLIGQLYRRLRGKSCQPMDCDFKIFIPGKGKIKGVYPDASVFCGPIEYIDDEQDLGTNPSALFEVLSPSTEAYESRREIRGMPEAAFAETVRLDRPRSAPGGGLSSATPRAAHGSTPRTWARSRGALPDIGIELPLADLYANVEFPP